MEMIYEFVNKYFYYKIEISVVYLEIFIFSIPTDHHMIMDHHHCTDVGVLARFR